MHARLAFEHVKARRRDPLLAQRVGERRVVDDPAARDVRERRARLHQRELGRADRVMTLRRVRQHEHDVIGLHEQRRLRHVFGVELGLDLGRDARAVVIDHAHAEAARAARERLADAAHAEHAERRAVNVRAEKAVVRPLAPLPRAQPVLGFGDPPRGRHHQRPAEIGRRLGQHVGRVGAEHVRGVERADVEVVVADRHVRHDAQPRRGREHRRVDHVARRQRAVLVREARLQRIGGERVAVVPVDVEILLEPLDHVRKDRARDQDFLHCRLRCAARAARAHRAAHRPCGRHCAA